MALVKDLRTSLGSSLAKLHSLYPLKTCLTGFAHFDSLFSIGKEVMRDQMRNIAFDLAVNDLEVPVEKRCSHVLEMARKINW